MPHEVRPRRTGAIRTIAIALVTLAATPVAVSAVSAGGAATPTRATSPRPDAVGFETLPPTRVVDTRRGMGSVRLSEAVPTRLQIRGRGAVPGDAITVSANFTVIRSGAGGSLTLWDCSAERPHTSAVDFGAVETVSAASTVSLDSDGGICALSTASTDLVVDVHGFHRAGGALGLSPLTPTRLVDTRDGRGAAGRIAARGTLELQIAGAHGITAGARAVALNVAAVDASTDGWVVAHACGVPRPSGVSLTHVRESVTANLVVSALSADGRVCLYSSAETDLVIDAVGSFATSAPLTYDPVVPARLLDTRAATPTASDAGTGGAPLAAGQVVRIQVSGRGGVPPHASALSGTIAVTGADTAGFATAFPCGAVPNTATVHFPRNAAISNGALLPLSPTGELCVAVSASAHLVIDVAGWWSDGDAMPADGPPALAPGTHNDTALAYQGAWAVAPSPGLHLGDNSYSNLTGSTASFRFTGSGFRLYTAKDSLHGVMAVSVDGGPEIDVDLYAPARHAALAYESVDLAAGTHTVMLKHTGRKNPNSTDTFVVVDRVDVVDETGSPAPSAPASTTAPPASTPPSTTTPAPPTTPPAPSPTPATPPTPPAPSPAPTTTSPATSPPPAPRPSGDVAATRDQVGPRVPRAERAGGRLPCGTYQAVRFTSRVSLAQEGCTYEFSDVEVCFEASAARRAVTVRHSHVTCGWYFEDGSHGGVTIEWSLVTSDCVGLRPQGATNGRVMEVRDSVIVVGGAVTSGGHCETLASFTLSGGLTSNVHITRSRLIAENRWTPGCGVHMCSGYTGITNVTGTDYVFTDVVFGDPAQPMPAWFMIYETGATFIRPRFHPGKAGVWFFPPPTGGELVEPTYL